jgi:hypothetical protein
MPARTDSIAKTALFRELGYAGPWEPLELVLEEAGLSRRTKQRISRLKTGAVQELLQARFVRVCGRGDCQVRVREISSGRLPVQAVRQADCEVCGGSVNRAAVDRMVTALTRTRWGRLCVVGGSPEAHRELEALTAGRLELRLVGNERRHTRSEAEANLRWADLVVIWGSTPIAHKVTALYPAGHARVLTLHKRGVAELARAVEQRCERQAAAAVPAEGPIRTGSD